MPTPSPSQFWELLSGSRLLAPAELHALRQSHAALPNAAADDTKAIASWLVQRGAITLWQARRLVAGKAGPFFVGAYRLLEQRPGEGEVAQFAARHEPSGRGVDLVMLNAKRCADPDVWTEIVARTAAATKAVDPVLSRTWALEQAGANRFIVCEPVAGETLAAELARRGPLPLAEAAEVTLTVARAVAEMHAAGRAHGSLSLDAVVRELGEAGGASGGVRLLQFPLVGDPHRVPLRPLVDTPEELNRLASRASFVAPELTMPGAECDTRSDVYALGCILHALVSGRPPCWKGDARATLVEAATVGPAQLAPPTVPVEVATLIGYLTARDPAARYPTAVEAAEAIAACFGLAAAADVGRPAAGGAGTVESGGAWPDVGAAPVVATTQPGRVVVPRKRGAGLGVVAALLVGLVGAAGGGYYLLSQPLGGGRPKPAPSPPPVEPAAVVVSESEPAERIPAPQKPAAADSQQAAPASVAPDATVASTAAAPEAPPADRRPSVQIVEDSALPWQSPTSGPSPALAYLPPNAEWFLLVRPADLLGDDEGRLFVKALGPGVEAALAGVAALAGCEPAELESVQVGWLAPSADELLVGLALRLVEGKSLPEDEAARRRAWAAMETAEIAGETVFVGDGRVFWMPPRERERVLVMAPRQLMEEIISAPEAQLERDLEQLVGMLDADRHLTLAGLPHHLLTNGRANAFPGSLSRLAEPLDAFCGDDVKAAAMSLHFGADCYAEVDAITSLDTPPAKAARLLTERLARLPDEVEAQCAALAADPHGGRLVMRLPAMLRSLVAQLRSGAEQGGVVLNAVLPRQAGHNIALASELALAQAPAAAAAPVAASTSAPADALGKLKKKMTLTFAKDTLEKTIQMISDETGVPMEIAGPDLQLEGITKNQSFGLDEQDKTAEQILKVVLQKANPDGKLVYVVTKLDGADAILITTRAAAEKRGDTLAPGQ